MDCIAAWEAASEREDRESGLTSLDVCLCFLSTISRFPGFLIKKSSFLILTFESHRKEPRFWPRRHSAVSRTRHLGLGQLDNFLFPSGARRPHHPHVGRCNRFRLFWKQQFWNWQARRSLQPLDFHSFDYHRRRVCLAATASRSS